MWHQCHTQRQFTTKPADSAQRRTCPHGRRNRYIPPRPQYPNFQSIPPYLRSARQKQNSAVEKRRSSGGFADNTKRLPRYFKEAG